MTDWGRGYDVSVGYTYGFGREMAPAWLNLCAGLAGWSPPTDRGLRYLDLGCGQGVSLCLLAASNPLIEFVGIDFHPEHIAHATGLADAASLTNIRFVQADFVDLASSWPDDLGGFDYLVLHGILSWISLAVRAAVITCIGHATKAGGLVYTGYNAHPGWLSTMPFQHVTHRLNQIGARSGREAIEASVAIFDRLRRGGAATFKILPGLGARVDSVKAQNANYLQAEYLAEWHPTWHSEIGDALKSVDLHYLGSATAAETLLPDVLPPPLRDTINDQTDPGLRQDLQDFVINQSFRRDLFRRGPASKKAVPPMGSTFLHLLAPPADGPIEIKAAFGEIALQPQAFREVITALVDGSKSIDELTALPVMHRQGTTDAVRLLMLLVHAGVVAPGPTEILNSDAACRLNIALAEGAAQGLPYGFVAAPKFGSAVPTDKLELELFGRWLADRTVTAATFAPDLADRSRAVAFLTTTLPRWRQLGAVV
jgi:SAM-dependent methyltransferase